MRSYLIHRLSSQGIDPALLIERLNSESDISIRRALVFGLGEFSESTLPSEMRTDLVPRLQEMYQTETDPGMHAACEWLLGKWEQEAWLNEVTGNWARGSLAEGAWRMEGQGKLVPPTQTSQPLPGWYVNSQGQTFSILNAGDFQMGSPASEARRIGNERLHTRVIGHRLAIATKEVTRAQWLLFSETESGKVVSADRDSLRHRPDDSPMAAMTWYEAAWYCNWLSEQEGIPEEQRCYAPNQDGVYGPGMSIKANFLELKGYRLPTDEEWEFACRAGAITARYYGQSDILLPNYGWCQASGDIDIQSVGRLKPNDYGLFDMLGNVSELCSDIDNPYLSVPGRIAADRRNSHVALPTDRRIVRGGAYNDRPLILRSARRIFSFPDLRDGRYGFRVARTL